MIHLGSLTISVGINNLKVPTEVLFSLVKQHASKKAQDKRRHISTFLYNEHRLIINTSLVHEETFIYLTFESEDKNINTGK